MGYLYNSFMACQELTQRQQMRQNNKRYLNQYAVTGSKIPVWEQLATESVWSVASCAQTGIYYLHPISTCWFQLRLLLSVALVVSE